MQQEQPARPESPAKQLRRVLKDLSLPDGAKIVFVAVRMIGKSATIAAIREATNMPTRTVKRHVSTLERAGFLSVTRAPGIASSYTATCATSGTPTCAGSGICQTEHMPPVAHPLSLDWHTPRPDCNVLALSPTPPLYAVQVCDLDRRQFVAEGGVVGGDSAKHEPLQVADNTAATKTALDKERSRALKLCEIAGLQPEPWVVSDVIRTLTLCTSQAMRNGQAEKSAQLYAAFCHEKGRPLTHFGLTKWLMKDDASHQTTATAQPTEDKRKARRRKLEAEQQAMQAEYDEATTKPIAERTAAEQDRIDELQVKIGRHGERITALKAGA